VRGVPAGVVAEGAFGRGVSADALGEGALGKEAADS